MNKENHYGNLNICELKKILKERGAKVTGRKSELVDRIIFYEKNNLDYEPVKSDAIIQTPRLEKFRDIHSGTPVPTFTTEHLMLFVENYNVKLEKPEKLYKDGFLQYARYAIEGEKYFLKGSCRAELKKYMIYNVNISLFMDGEVKDSTCECPVGHSTNAHCKHVIVLLFALANINKNGNIILEKSCTEKLQKFHRPSKKYSGSPVKAQQFLGVKQMYVCEDYDEGFKSWYKNYPRNMLIGRSYNNRNSLKQTIEPANIYAVENDHGLYAKNSNEYKLLKSLGLIDLSEIDAKRIEFETRDQSSSKLWKTARSVRLTASIFHSCCSKYFNPDGAKSLVKKILYPTSLLSLPTQHGKIYEKVAIKKFNELHCNLLNLQTCGLHIAIERPYLGGTPDCLSASETVIEVKCPYASRNMMINEKTVPYLEKDSDGKLRLKENIHISTRYEDIYILQAENTVTL